MISTKLTLLLIACYSLSFVFSFYNHKSKFLSTWTFIKKEIVIKNHKSALIVLLSTSPQNENNIRVNSTSSASSSINESSSPVLFGGEGDDYFNISSSVDQASEFRDIFTNYKKRIEKEMRSFSKRSFSVIDGSFAGDIGFDPLGLSDNAAQLRRMREIELKHSRIAMMAVVVWPLIELSQPTDNSICLYTSATSCVDSEMTIASGAFLKSFSTGLFFVFSSALEYLAFLNRRSLTKKYIEPGDFGFDPFNFYELRGGSPAAKRSMRAGEVWNGRFAMVALLSFYLIEKFTSKPIMEAFFSPFV